MDITGMPSAQAMLPGHRAGLHPHQGGAHWSRPRPPGLGGPRLGEPPGGRLLDLPHGGGVGWPAGRLRQPARDVQKRYGGVDPAMAAMGFPP